MPLISENGDPTKLKVCDCFFLFILSGCAWIMPKEITLSCSLTLFFIFYTESQALE